jgi:hypothetical protein
LIDPGLVSLIELGVLTVGVAIAVLEIRNMSQTRRTEVTLQFFDKFTRPEFSEQYRHVVFEQQFESYEEWFEKYGPTINPEAYNNMLAVVGVNNSTGRLLRKGIADPDFVFDFMPPYADVRLWEKLKPFVEGRRRLWKSPRYLESFEYLYDEAKKRLPQ